MKPVGPSLQRPSIDSSGQLAEREKVNELLSDDGSRESLTRVLLRGQRDRYVEQRFREPVR